MEAPNPADLDLDSSPAVVPPTSLKMSKILVVEDEPDARELFTSLLESTGRYDVSGAADGTEALAKCAAERFDLVLLDIVMPNKDGTEVLQEIKADEVKYGKPIVVMLTNISGDAAVEKAMDLGAAGFKLKIGTDPEELLQEVEAFLGGKIQNIKEEPVTDAIGDVMQHF